MNMTSKIKINTVSVPFAELLKFAAAPKMKRMPRGVKGHIEKHTIIEFHPTFLVVDAPAQSNVIQVKCGFRQSVKVGSQHLAVTLQKLPKAETMSSLVIIQPIIPLSSEAMAWK
jgi:hypothetical protein